MQRFPSLDTQRGLAAVDQVTVVPDIRSDPGDQTDAALVANDGSRAHVYFKDLKLLADGEDSEEELEPDVFDEASPHEGSDHRASPSESNDLVRCLDAYGSCDASVQ